MARENKKTIIAYWVFTIVICLMQSVMAFMELNHDLKVVKSLTDLGYPEYILNIIGLAKIIGVVVLLIPRFPRLKEWAYAGFAIAFTGGFLSHFFMGDGIDKLAPAIVSMVILLIGYSLRPESRKLAKV